MLGLLLLPRSRAGVEVESLDKASSGRSVVGAAGGVMVTLSRVVDDCEKSPAIIFEVLDVHLSSLRYYLTL